MREQMSQFLAMARWQRLGLCQARGRKAEAKRIETKTRQEKNWDSVMVFSSAGATGDFMTKGILWHPLAAIPPSGRRGGAAEPVTRPQRLHHSCWQSLWAPPQALIGPLKVFWRLRPLSFSEPRTLCDNAILAPSHPSSYQTPTARLDGCSVFSPWPIPVTLGV